MLRINLAAKQTKITRSILALLLGILLLANYSFSQNKSVQFESLSLQKGVSLNLTFTMLQDSRGFIWFGTMYGLVRFDGVNYITFRNDPNDSSSISFDDITALFEDHNKNLWVGTWGGGLNKFDPVTGKFTRFLYKDADTDGLGDNIIWTINEDDLGNIWIGTGRGGVDKYIPSKNKFIHYSYNPASKNSIPHNNIKKIFKDKDGNMWIGTIFGMAKYLPSSDSFEIYKNGNDPDPFSGINLITSIAQDNENKIWIGTALGLYILDESKKLFIPVKFTKNSATNYILSICVDKQNILWVGTTNGLINLNKNNPLKSESFYHEYNNSNSVIGNRISALMVDASGVLWINAYQSGISKLISSERNFNYFYHDPDNKNTIAQNSTAFFAEDQKGYVWIVGYSNILNRLDPKNNNIKRFPLFLNKSKNPQSFIITSLAIDNNNLWVGTTKGILLFDLSDYTQQHLTEKMIKIPNLAYGNISYLYLSENKKLLIGVYEQGLYSYDLKANTYKHFMSPRTDLNSYSRNIVQVIYQDKDQNIWAGTNGGLLKINQETWRAKVYSHVLSDSNSLSNNYVYYLYTDSRNNFWIGTSNGLKRFDKSTEKFYSFFEKEGLPNNVIMAILEDKKGNLWISTNKGLSRFDIAKRTFKNYELDDGLQSNIFFPQSALASRSGRFYFGGNNGFNSFWPDKIVLNHFIPQVHITSLKIGKDIGDIKTRATFPQIIKVAFDKNFFEIDFAALDFTNPAKNVYKYKLEGVDEEWIYSGNNSQAVYTNLSPGNYFFQVKGSNSDGIWNENAASLEIVILPPFWRTWWFISMITLVSFVLIYLSHLFWLRHKIRHALEIEKIRIEESEKVRKQTATDFHDELGHRLTRISLLTEIVKRKLENGQLDVAPLLKKISENSVQLYEGTKDFIWAIDPQNDALFELLVRLKDFGDEIFTETDVDFIVKGISGEIENISLSPDLKRHIALIFKEGMNNSLKHSHSKVVSLESKIQGEEVEIILKDDGSGFDLDRPCNGNGIKNMIKRANNIQGKLDINSAPGKGTKISFKCKINNKTQTTA